MTELGEKLSKFFFGLEQHRQPKNAISELQTNTGVVKTDIDILTNIQEFYESLYTSEPTDTDEQRWLINQLSTSLTQPNQVLCDGPITEEEVKQAIHDMAYNKSPGPDGIATEFYKRFSNSLTPHLVHLYNTNYDVGQMSPSQQSALLRLLYKKDDRTLLKNWRPISLLNVDYKILAKVLAARLKKVLPLIIHSDQTCGVPGRSIYDNLFKLRDITHHATVHHTNVILVSLDQEKAFDRVDHAYLHQILTKFNFGQSFRHWITTLYANATCRVINNGWLTDEISLRRGLRQGCPLSPLLYILTAEPLGQAIRNDPKVHGVHIPGGHGAEDKISQYADDSTLTLTDDPSLIRAFNILDRYQAGSGSKLNLTKTEGTYIGRHAGKTHGPIPIKWKAQNLTILGIQIGSQMHNQNWAKHLTKLQQRLKLWTSRPLSTRGKTTLLKTYGLTQFIYLASIFNIPPPIATIISKVMFQFLWGGQTELIRRTTLQQPIHNGGLAIPDPITMNKSLKVKCLRHISNANDNRSWCLWARYYIGTHLSTLKPTWGFLRSNLNPHADPNEVPDWHQTTHEAARTLTPFLNTIDDHQINNKIVYSHLLPKDPPRAEATWPQEYNVPANTVQDNWSTIWSGLANNRAKETTWRMAHLVITSKAFLSRWNHFNINPDCPFCNNRETTEHVFFCNRTRDLWSLSNSLLDVIDQRVTSTLSSITFHHLRHRSITASSSLSQFIIATTSDIIWRTRNQRIRGEPTPPDLPRELKKRIRERIEDDLLNNKRKIIDRYWSYKNILVKFVHNKPVINI